MQILLSRNSHSRKRERQFVNTSIRTILLAEKLNLVVVVVGWGGVGVFVLGLSPSTSWTSYPQMEMRKRLSPRPQPVSGARRLPWIQSSTMSSKVWYNIHGWKCIVPPEKTMTTCCFISIVGILENQDSEFLAWVLVSTWGIMWGRPEGGSLGRIPGSDLGCRSGPGLRWEGTSKLALPHFSFWAFPAQHSPSLSGPRSHCVHGALWGLIKEKETWYYSPPWLMCNSHLTSMEDLMACICTLTCSITWTSSILIFPLPNCFIYFSILVYILHRFIIYLVYVGDKVIFTYLYVYLHLYSW